MSSLYTLQVLVILPFAPPLLYYIQSNHPCSWLSLRVLKFVFQLPESDVLYILYVVSPHFNSANISSILGNCCRINFFIALY